MEWITRLNSAMHYIEEHLTEKINYDELAKIACCSSYHFQRMFSYMANVPLSEYIRRRRMTRAAVDLQSSDEKVINLALKYGYDSPTAFNRAFQGIHGISPSQARVSGTALKAYPPISFSITVKGDTQMNYRVERKDAIRIVGVAESLDKEVAKNFQTVPLMWQRCTTDGSVEKIASFINAEPYGLLGVSLCNDTDDWRYFIAASSTLPVSEGLSEYVIPPSTWAIFPGEGDMPYSIQALQKRIVTEWLPTSGYEYANIPDIEVYLSSDPKNPKYEVWIPIIKKP